MSLEEVHRSAAKMRLALSRVLHSENRSRVQQEVRERNLAESMETVSMSVERMLKNRQDRDRLWALELHLGNALPIEATRFIAELDTWQAKRLRSNLDIARSIYIPKMRSVMRSRSEQACSVCLETDTYPVPMKCCGRSSSTCVICCKCLKCVLSRRLCCPFCRRPINSQLHFEFMCALKRANILLQEEVNRAKVYASSS